MDFDKRKALTLASMASTTADKSPKGTIDTPIIPLLNTLNHHPSYFTTSSCSGRITIFSSTPTKPKGGTWVFITHDLADPSMILDLLFSGSKSARFGPIETGSELVFRFEPLIIAVECRDVGAAQNLVGLAVSSGFRESGVTSVSNKRVMVAIRCSIRLEVPLGSKLMVSPEYVEYLVGIANEKMAANRRRTEGFMEVLRRNGFVGDNGVDKNGDDLMLLDGEIDRNASICGESHVVEEDDGSDVNDGRANSSSLSGPPGNLDHHISVASIKITGEPVERLYLWGHSSCTIGSANSKVLIYGGFGGIGRHARRSDCLLLDPFCGTLTALNVQGGPSPRLGHTCSLVGDLLFVIGGRADPVNILNDVWIFNTATNEWKFVECGGSVFASRHRHAAVSLGSKIYTFGGLNNDTIYSSMLVLDVDTLHWNEVHATGEWPCARHSHSLVAHGHKLYLFGGYDGEKVLGDLYSFDVQNCQWERVKMAGKAPCPRFSHSMFVYKDYLGIIGGCPVKQNYQELALLDLQTLLWKIVTLDSTGRDLFVRSTGSIVSDELIMIGGGAACYAFGTKFSEPLKINLLPLMSSRVGQKSSVKQRKDYLPNIKSDNGILHNGAVQIQPHNGSSDLNLNSETSADTRHITRTKNWVLKLERTYAKLSKDILKKFGWLDLGRKVYSEEDGSCIYFPVTEKFSAIFGESKLPQSGDKVDGLNDIDVVNSPTSHAFSLNEVSHLTGLGILVACGATKVRDTLVKTRKSARSPVEEMREVVASLIERKGLYAELLQELPTRWDRLGDIVLLPVNSFKDSSWNKISDELWPAIAKCLGARRLARQGRVAPTGTRDSGLEILVGDNGWVEHRENGIFYCFDARKCMFSWGNLSEKIRMAQLDCKDEIIVDLFAGIGYFTLPFLVRVNAKLVYACEWNPFAIQALRHNLQANSASDRCIVLEGDNRLTAPQGVADRVCLGLLPSSEGSWVTAVRALRSEGGTLHIHGNVKDSEEVSWTVHVLKTISDLAKSEGHCWEVGMEHLERVKWYAPHIRHLVMDIKCKQIPR